MDKNERITCTPHSKQEYEMVELLSELSGKTFSFILAEALHIYLKNNFESEVKRYLEIGYLLNTKRGKQNDY